MNEEGEKRGCFSLVFKAFDVAHGKNVALKFYDLDPLWRNDAYRMAGFRREHEILQGLLDADRCLQLASAMSSYSLTIDLPGVEGITIPCEYFAVEWLEDDIDAYFHARREFDVVDRLRLFHQIVLCVEALHRHEVFHRDLKPDNLRTRTYADALKRLVVAIDLGTAARFDSLPISADYGASVGAPAYAAPEALAGLAGNRAVAPAADHWALGCLLFELFNPDYFVRSLHAVNPGLHIRIAAMAGDVSGIGDPSAQIRGWNAAVSRLGKGVTPVAIDGLGSWVPRGIAPLLNDLLRVLTSFDYRNRQYRQGWISQRVHVAIRILNNEREYARRLEEVRSRRARRQAATRFAGRRPLALSSEEPC